MVNLVCCMKSKDSYNRIINFQENKRIEWEEFINDIDDIREKMLYTNYDIAIIDEKLWWKDECIELLNRKGVKVIIFQGDFEEVTNQIIKELPDEEPVIEQVLNFSTEDNTKILNKPIENEPEIKYIPKIEYIEREVKVPVTVYQSVYAGIQNKVILVLNLTERAGSTFFSLNLAKAFASNNILTSVVEPPLKTPYIFDSVGLDKRLNITDENSNKFYSYAHEIFDNKKIESNREAINDGIVWIVPDPKLPKIKEWDYLKMMKLLYVSKRASINIIDCGYSYKNKCVQEILSEADMILVIIDPLPADIMQNDETLEELITMKKDGFPIEFIINKWNKGVNKKELLNFLDIIPLMYVPYISPEFVYKATYNCKIAYEYEEVKEDLQDIFLRLIEKFVPKDLLKKDSTKENKNLFKSLFRSKK